jgi:hypothetical protein
MKYRLTENIDSVSTEDVAECYLVAEYCGEGFNVHLNKMNGSLGYHTVDEIWQLILDIEEV